MRQIADVTEDAKFRDVFPFGKSIGPSATGKSRGGEWLYDLCWLEYVAPDSDVIVGMPLALESEWGNDTEILEDFQKLLVSRAALRVMIFGERNRSTECTKKTLCKQIESYRDGDVDDRYLLAAYDAGRFVFFLLDGNGRTLETTE